MKNKIKRITSLVLCMVLCLSVFAGCAQTNNGGTTATSEKDTPITLGHVGIEGMIQARAGDTTGYTGNMWVYTKSATNSGEKYNSEKVLWTVTDGVPTLENATPTLYTGIEGDQTVWAFTSQSTIYELPPYFLSNVFNVMDILYGKTTLYGAEVETLLMRHLFTKVTVNITEFGSELSYTPEFKNDLESDGVWLTGLLSKVKIDHSGVDNPVSPADDAEYNGETKMCYIGQNENTGYYQSDALVFPSAENTEVGICVRVTVNGEEKYLTTTFQPCRKDGEGNIINYGFEAGYHYTVNLKVGLDKVEVDGITVSNWNGSTAEQPDTGWSTETNLDGTEGTIGNADAGKTAWVAGDKLNITLNSQKYGVQTTTAINDGSPWTIQGELKYLADETPTVTATYGTPGGTTEYLQTTPTFADGKLQVNFGTRNYSRLRIAGAANTKYQVTVTSFVPAGATDEAETYTLTTDSNGNMFLYGTWKQGSVITVKSADGTTKIVEHTVTGECVNGQSYVLDARPAYTYDETTKTFTVYSAEGLYAWLEAAQTDLSTKLVLMADITLPNKDLTTGEEITVENGVPSGSNWTPISTNWEKGYIGTFDGNNHTITGLRINTEEDYASLIGTLGADGEVKNLTLANAVVYGTGSSVSGFVAYISGGTISGCTFGSSTTDGSSVSGTGSVGGIIYKNASGLVSYCINNGTISASGTYAEAGGIAAQTTSNGTVSNCINNGSVSVSGGSETTFTIAGGIVGYTKSNSTVSGCTNNGSVSATGANISAGGIVGWNANSTVSGCENTINGNASVDGTADTYVGGIVGFNSEGTVDDTNENKGTPTTNVGNG